MSYPVNYKEAKAPKIRVVANSIGAFSSLGKQLVEEQFKILFAQFKEEGVISEDSIFYPPKNLWS